MKSFSKVVVRLLLVALFLASGVAWCRTPIRDGDPGTIGACLAQPDGSRITLTAEQILWRGITCNTSRVALAIARQRLIAAVFDHYELPHPEEGVGSGFKYKTVSHVTLKSIANNPEIDGLYARLHPAIEKALAEHNAALKTLNPNPSPTGREGNPRFRVTTVRREGHSLDFAAPDSATFTTPSRQVVKVNELVEYEVPFEFLEEWPEAASQAFDDFR